MIVLGGLVGGLIAVIGVSGGFDQEDPPAWALVLLLVVGYGVLPLAPPVYEIAMVAKKGATLGKLAMGLRVIKLSDGGRPGVGVSLLRHLIPLGAGWISCGLGMLLVYLSPVFDKSPAKQGWHDMAASTMVIRTR